MGMYTKYFMHTTAKISNGLKKGDSGIEGHHYLAKSALTCLKGGPFVDAPRVQTVMTKRESEIFCAKAKISFNKIMWCSLNTDIV